MGGRDGRVLTQDSLCLQWAHRRERSTTRVADTLWSHASDSTQDNGLPFLNHIPILDRLFGTTNRNRSRMELIVLITPKVIQAPADARPITDVYEAKFKSIKPIRSQVVRKIGQR